MKNRKSGNQQSQGLEIKGKQQNNKTTKKGGWIEVRAGKYAYLRWEFGGRVCYLGIVKDSPTGLLDLSIEVATTIELFELRKLLAANKSMR